MSRRSRWPLWTLRSLRTLRSRVPTGPGRSLFTALSGSSWSKNLNHMNFLASFTVLKLRNLGFETIKSVLETFFSTITFLTKYIQPMTTNAISHVYFKPLIIFTASFSHCVRMFLKRGTTLLEFDYIGIKYSC